jgi:hypothetical protein
MVSSSVAGAGESYFSFIKKDVTVETTLDLLRIYEGDDANGNGEYWFRDLL